MGLVLLPCTLCLQFDHHSPEKAEPAESVLSMHCTECLEADQIRVCVMHAIEVRANAEDGSLHCSACHAHPRHTCAPVIIDAEVPL